MRLAIVRKRYNPFGGAERVIERLIPYLGGQGISVSILTQEWPQQGKFPPTILKVPKSGFGRRSRFLKFQKDIQLLFRDNGGSKNFDLIQSHERIVGADIFRAGDGVHQSWINRLQIEAGFCRKVTYSFDPYHRLILHTERLMAADGRLRYVVNSELIAKELESYLGVNPHRVTYIPNGIDTNYFFPKPKEERIFFRRQFAELSGLSLPDGTPLVCFVGSGFQRKGVYWLIQAAQRLKDLNVIICGEDKKSSQYQFLISKLGLKKRVALVGPLKDVRALLWASDMLALPSLYDPSPSAVTEALACGIPVVITSAVGLSSEIISAGAGVLCERNRDSVADALCRGLKLTAIDGIIERARHLALGLEQDKVFQLWIDFYQKLLKENS